MKLSSNEKKIIYTALKHYIPIVEEAEESKDVAHDAIESLVSQIKIIQEKIEVDLEIEE